MLRRVFCNQTQPSPYCRVLGGSGAPNPARKAVAAHSRSLEQTMATLHQASLAHLLGSLRAANGLSSAEPRPLLGLSRPVRGLGGHVMGRTGIAADRRLPAEPVLRLPCRQVFNFGANRSVTVLPCCCRMSVSAMTSLRTLSTSSENACPLWWLMISLSPSVCRQGYSQGGMPTDRHSLLH